MGLWIKLSKLTLLPKEKDWASSDSEWAVLFDSSENIFRNIVAILELTTMGSCCEPTVDVVEHYIL